MTFEIFSTFGRPSGLTILVFFERFYAVVRG